MADIPLYFLFCDVHGHGSPSLPETANPWNVKVEFYDQQADGDLSEDMVIVGAISNAQARVISFHGDNTAGSRAKLYLDGGQNSVIPGIPLAPPVDPDVFSVKAAGSPGVAVTSGTRTFSQASGDWSATLKQYDTLLTQNFTNAENNGSFIVESVSALAIVVYDTGILVTEGANTSATLQGQPNMDFMEGEQLEDAASPGTVIGRFGYYKSNKIHDFWASWNDQIGLALLNEHGPIAGASSSPDTSIQSNWNQYLFEKQDPRYFKIIQQGSHGVHYWDSSMDETDVTILSAGAVTVSSSANTFTAASWVETPDPGDRIITSDFGSAANNGEFTVKTATATVITIYPPATALVNTSEAATIVRRTYGRWVVYHPHVNLTHDDAFIEGLPGSPNLQANLGTSGSNHQLKGQGGLGPDVGLMHYLRDKHPNGDFALVKIQWGPDSTVGTMVNGGMWRADGFAFNEAIAQWESAWRAADSSATLGEAPGNQWDVRGFFCWFGDSDIQKFRADVQADAAGYGGLPDPATLVGELRTEFGGTWNGGTQSGSGDTDNFVLFVYPHSHAYENQALVSQGTIGANWPSELRVALQTSPPEAIARGFVRDTIRSAAGGVNVLTIDPSQIGNNDPERVFSVDQLGPSSSTEESRWMQTDVYIRDIPEMMGHAVDVWEGKTFAVLTSPICIPTFIMAGQSQVGTFVQAEYAARSVDTEYAITDHFTDILAGKQHSTDPDARIWNGSKLIVEPYDIALNTNTGTVSVVVDGVAVSTTAPSTFYLPTGVWDKNPVAGQKIDSQNFGNPANNGVFTVASATASTCIVEETSLVTQVGAGIDIISADSYPLTNMGGGFIGPELGWFPAMRTALGMPVLLLKSAFASASLTLEVDPRGSDPKAGVWTPNANNLYDNLLAQYGQMLDYLHAQGMQADLNGIFWYQGYSDGLGWASASDSYQTQLELLINSAQDDFATRCTGNPVPFVVMQSPSYYEVTYELAHPGLGASNLAALRSAQANAVSNTSSSILVNGDTLEPQLPGSGGVPNVHLDGESVINAGIILAGGYKTLAGIS